MLFRQCLPGIGQSGFGRVTRTSGLFYPIPTCELENRTSAEAAEVVSSPNFLLQHVGSEFHCPEGRVRASCFWAHCRLLTGPFSPRWHAPATTSCCQFHASMLHRRRLQTLPRGSSMPWPQRRLLGSGGFDRASESQSTRSPMTA